VQPIASELFAQNTVLFLKIHEHVLLPLIQEAGKGNQQEPKRIQYQTHGAIIALKTSAKGAPDRHKSRL
jgi:hypothetical protein